MTEAQNITESIRPEPAPLASAATYTRLPGRSHLYFGIVHAFELLFTFGLVTLAPRCRVYRTGDHLLVLCRRFFAESAHRFYYRDIQAITVHRTLAGRHATAICFGLSGLALLLLLSAPLISLSGIEVSILSVFTAVFAVAGGFNILLGPTCTTELHTAVYCEALPNLRRWRTAQRFLKAVAPEIEAAQGALGTDEIAAAVAAPRLVTGRYSTPPVAARLKSAVIHEEGRIHSVLFGLCLLMGISAGIDLFVTSQIKAVLGLLAFTVSLFVGCLALARQRNSDLPQDLRALTGFTLILLVVLFYVAQFTATVKTFSDPEFATGGFAFRMQTIEARAFIFLELVVYTAVGLLGLMGLHRFRRLHRRAQPVRQAPAPVAVKETAAPAASEEETL